MKKLPIHQYLPHASELVYGCMGLGGSWNKDPLTQKDFMQAHQVIEHVLDSQINFFDHADIYQFGKAEQVFGKVLKENPSLRENMIIQSKCGIRFEDKSGPARYDLSGEWICESTNNILARLNTEYLDVLVLHRPDPLMDPEEIAQAFADLKASGKVKYFGLSNMHISQAAYLAQAIEQPLIVNQLELSLTNLNWLEEGVFAGNPDGSHVNFTSGTLEYARRNDMQIQSWGSLSQGLFSGKDISKEPIGIQRTAEYIKTLADVYNTSPESIVLAWLLRHPSAVQPVIGSTNIQRISACKQALAIKLTREQWYQIYILARGAKLP
ncbi:aldo/keto reductase [Pseudoalteromonas sp. C2R02]|uniref:aldo/keto reductase n=1 Tax=Pseudoalteromonas sp. C2R02 TaxID=2841565 RepID=UPI001C09793D|nr:aldo/keto reductase [Pseudoalteromonas sp. C2R02]MBU2971993.1 aldo/keto reductase [Pseudoalteromonas sp. C2R02]